MRPVADDIHLENGDSSFSEAAFGQKINVVFDEFHEEIVIVPSSSVRFDCSSVASCCVFEGEFGHDTNCERSRSLNSELYQFVATDHQLDVMIFRIIRERLGAGDSHLLLAYCAYFNHKVFLKSWRSIE